MHNIRPLFIYVYAMRRVSTFAPLHLRRRLLRRRHLRRRQLRRRHLRRRLLRRRHLRRVIPKKPKDKKNQLKYLSEIKGLSLGLGLGLDLVLGLGLG